MCLTILTVSVVRPYVFGLNSTHCKNNNYCIFTTYNETNKTNNTLIFITTLDERIKLYTILYGGSNEKCACSVK